jgi:hypothetical protein
MRRWKTEIHSVDKGDGSSPTTAFKTFNLLEAKAILTKIRTNEAAAGLPRRSISPISRYILEELIENFLKNDAKDNELVKITIEDTKYNGI